MARRGKDDDETGQETNSVVVPERLIDEIIEIALNRSGGFDKINRAVEMSGTINEYFDSNSNTPEELKVLTNELSAYIAHLDDQGTLKENEETIKELANFTASPEEYAKMFATVGNNFYRDSADTASSIAYYLNSSDLSKEEISTFVATLNSNIEGTNLSIQIEDAIKEIEDPATKALVEYNYVYFSDHPSELNAGGTQLTAPDLINYTDIDTFNKAFENDPEGKRAFLKYLIENEPEKAAILASNLGHDELVALNKLLLSETSLGYLNYAETYRELTTQELATLLTGSQFPVPELASPVVEATPPASDPSSPTNEQQTSQEETTEEVASESETSDLESPANDDIRLSEEDLIAMQNDFPLVGEFIKDVKIPNGGYTIEEFEAAITNYANGLGRENLGLAEGTYSFEASLTADGDHITNVSLTKGGEADINQAATDAGMEEVSTNTAPITSPTGAQIIGKNSAISI